MATGPAASGPPAMTPYAIAVALFAASWSAVSSLKPCRCGWSFWPASRSERPCSSSSTATRTCPGVGGHDELTLLRPPGQH